MNSQRVNKSEVGVSAAMHMGRHRHEYGVEYAIFV